MHQFNFQQILSSNQRTIQPHKQIIKMSLLPIYVTILVCILQLLAISHADNIDKNAEVRSFKNEAPDAEGNYHYNYETSNGIQFEEAGNAAGIQGAFNYISPEGERFALTYTADEEGYHPVGDHLPTPPPIPKHVLRALEYIRLHPPPLLNVEDIKIK